MARIQSQAVRRRSQRSSPNRIILILAGAFVLVAVIAGFVAYNLVKTWKENWEKTQNVTYVAGSPGLNLPTQVNAQGTPIPPNVPLQAVSGPAPSAWDGTSRVTVLLVGLDYRDWEKGEIPRSDSMMLLTIDPLSKTAGMLSIPRDLWVNIPGYGYYKINQAYFFGAANKLPGGGPALAIDTVQKFLGVPINYYAQIDFAAFEKFIDILGGVAVNVPQDIWVDPLGQGNTVLMRKGKMVYPGNVILAYARARYTTGGDFDRAQRQQQVVMGIREKILVFNMLPELVAKAPQLYQHLSDGIKTNLSLDQVIQLSWLAFQIKKENIKQGIIGTNEVQIAKSADGLDILVPISDKIRLVRDSIFTTGGPVGPAAVGQDPKVLMGSEKAKVSVKNGTSTNGLAGKTGTYLKGMGVNVAEEGTADRTYDATEIVLYTGKPYTTAYLSTIFNVPTARILNKYDPASKVDIVINLGRDWAQKNPMP